MLSLDEILKEVEDKTNIPREQLLEKINQKYEELSGLVSLEGAGHLVARDLGVNLLTLDRKPLKIQNLSEGLKNVRIMGQIKEISPIREFEKKDKTKGKVCNIFLSDSTGDIRLPLWDKQVEMVENGTLGIGSTIEIVDASVRKNAYSGLELVLNKFSQIRKLEDSKISHEPIPTITAKRIELKDAEEGYFEITGTFVQLFSSSVMFQMCPTCRGPLEKVEDGYKCEQHGSVEPDTAMIISGIVDDGTSSIRTVFFREQAEKFSGISVSIIAALSQEEALSMIKESVLGKEVSLRGRLRKSKLFDSLEFVVSDVNELDLAEESKRLLDEIEKYGE